MSTVHKNLTGADLHEPKGADTALNGQVYVSNGSGGGVWTTASSIITNTAFSTGDLKLTHKVTADSGWLMWAEGTIGDGSSGATLLASSSAAALFTLYWTINPTGTLVSGGRGLSAAADFAAHKTLHLPPGPGRSLVVAGVATGLTTRTFLESGGSETVTLVANQIPTLTSSGSNTITVASTTPNTVTGTIQSANVTGGADRAFTSNGANVTISSSAANSITVSYTNASQQTVSLTPPSIYINVMIKL